MGQMKKVVAKQLLAEESDFVPYPREVREGQRAQMKREREARGSSRWLPRNSCFPLLARQLEQTLGPARGLEQGEAPESQIFQAA